LKDFAVVVLFTLSGILFWMTPLAFFLVAALETTGPAGLYYEWLTVVPPVAIILLWAFLIRRWRKGEHKGGAK
jgi:hypothetical protein